MREIVTLQVGNFANYVGSHFWNFQDELLGLAGDPHSDPVFKNHSLDMDALYRTGETPQGVLSYTPRLVSIDFQGTLGSLSSRGTLYNDTPPVSSHIATWSGKVSTESLERRKKNLFLKSLCDEENEKNDSESQIEDKDIVESLENGVQYWTDFSKVHYHPQSLYELNGLLADVQEFDNYGFGRDVISASAGLHREEINERLRFFVEECDHIQGFQFIVDDSGGFSSLASEFLENIADEYTNTPVLLYAVRGPGSHMDPTSSRKQKIARILHDAVSFPRLSSFCKLMVPLGLPFLSRSKASTYLRIEDKKPYHCSAVYAAALHSISLPFRVGPSAESHNISGAVDVNAMVQMLACQARQNMVAILDAAMPAPSLTGKQVGESLVRNLQPLTPEVAESVEDLYAVESLTIHGGLGSGGRPTSVSDVHDAVDAAYEYQMKRPIFSHLCVTPCPLPIPLPFPSIFGNLVGRCGELFESPVSDSTSRGSLDVHSIPMAVRLRSSSAVLPFLENRLGNLRKFGIERGALGGELLRNWGFGKEEVEDMGELLSKMVATLDPHSEEYSDSD